MRRPKGGAAAAAGGGAVALSWRRLLRAAFAEVGSAGEACDGVSVKRLRRRCCAAAEAAYAAAGQAAPDRGVLEAKFEAKLAASRDFELAGKRVRRAAPAPAEDEEEEGPSAEERRSRAEAAKQRPSYVAWHGAPQAQRFGPFSSEEKEVVDEAIRAYADEQALDPASLEWLFHTRKGGATSAGAGEGEGGAQSAEPKAKQRAVWLRLAEALPHRSPNQVWSHATRRHAATRASGPWGEEESAALRRLVGLHRHDWVTIGAHLERLPDGCRDRWRKIGKQYAKGAWGGDECAALREAVAAAVAARPARPPPTASGGVAFVTIDNLDWGVIAAAVGTRSAAAARQKWYQDYAPSMQDSGTWGAGDDGRLLRFLRDARAGEETEVDWAAAVAGRGGAAALRRWKLMLKHVPGCVDRGFEGCVAFLVDKFKVKLAQADAEGAAE